MSSAQDTARKLWLPTLVILVAYVVAMYFFTDVLTQLGINPGPVPIGAVLALSGGRLLHLHAPQWVGVLSDRADDPLCRIHHLHGSFSRA